MKALYRELFGNSSDNSITGKAGPERIYGFAGKDKLYGQGGADILDGGDGNDVLDGGAGHDEMYGGSGDDLYRVNSYGDFLSEGIVGGSGDAGGVDTVESLVDFTLGAAFEKLALTGVSAINGVGNESANTIKGNEQNNIITGLGGADDLRGNGGDDILVGGVGRDTLNGGSGSDIFVLGKADVTSTDRVVDFSVAEDWIGIYAGDYGLDEGAGLTGGELDPTYFAIVSGTQKQGTVQGHGQFVYNNTSGALMWDADGSATAATGLVIANFTAVNGAAVALTASRIKIMDETPGVSVAAEAQTAQAEGDAVFFKIALDSPANSDVLVTYAVEAGAATQDDLALPLGSASVTIRTGEATAIISVPTLDDNSPEGTETFSLRILSATLGDGTALDITNAVAAGAIIDEGAIVVNEFLTKDLGGVGQGSSDPSGLAYVPGIGLILSDSEVDESPFSRTNTLFSMNTDGSGSVGYSLETRQGSFTNEPTGLAYDQALNRLYISDDDLFRVFWVDPQNPTVAQGSFATPRAADDPEDVAVDPVTGHVFIVNGLSHSIVEVDPASGAQVGATIELDGAIISDPEALVYDPQHQVFYVGGDFSNLIWKVDKNGQILETIDALAGYANPVTGTRAHVKDLDFAPTSDLTDDPSSVALYVADYGNNHLTQARSDDGRILELHLVDGSGWMLA